MRALALRGAAPLAALAAFAAMAALHLAGNDAAYVAVLRAWGIAPFTHPFLDAGGNLAAWNCARLGEDVIGFNPCDIMGRSFNYGPLLQDFRFVPLYPADRLAVGAVLDIAFLASFALLPPPPDWRGAGVMALAAVSTAVVFAVERANPDILVYLLLLPVGGLMARGGVARAAGYALVWLCAGLKFYPAALLGLALRERPARFCAVALASVLLAGLYVAQYHHALARILPLLPTGNHDSDLFAAKNLPMRLGLVTQVVAGTTWAVLAGGVILVLLLARMARQCGRLLAAPGFAPALAALPARTHMLLLMGCLLIGFCFFAGQNIAYRAIFLMFALPGLIALTRAGALRRVTAIVLFLMWEGAFRLGLDRALDAAGLEEGTAFLARFVYWLARELAWWWAVGAMVAIILRFAWDSPVRRAVWREI